MAIASTPTTTASTTKLFPLKTFLLFSFILEFCTGLLVLLEPNLFFPGASTSAAAQTASFAFALVILAIGFGSLIAYRSPNVVSPRNATSAPRDAPYVMTVMLGFYNVAYTIASIFSAFILGRNAVGDIKWVLWVAPSVMSPKDANMWLALAGGVVHSIMAFWALAYIRSLKPEKKRAVSKKRE